LTTSEPLQRARALLREKVPHLEDDRMMAPDIEAASGMIRSGALARAAGASLLPALEASSA
jgi:histidine ammonia-lyase